MIIGTIKDDLARWMLNRAVWVADRRFNSIAAGPTLAESPPGARSHAPGDLEAVEGRVALNDRLVHHAEVVSMKGDGYRLKDRDLGRVPADDAA